MVKNQNLLGQGLSTKMPATVNVPILAPWAIQHPMSCLVTNTRCNYRCHWNVPMYFMGIEILYLYCVPIEILFLYCVPIEILYLYCVPIEIVYPCSSRGYKSNWNNFVGKKTPVTATVANLPWFLRVTWQHIGCSQGAKASALTVAGTFVGIPLPKSIWFIPSTECLPYLFY